MHDIYDRCFKKILTLSSKSVINMINGLFNTNYPLDSSLTYNWTEFHDDNLRKTLADTIITINNSNYYHIEAQITIDENIVFRVFDYGYHFAERECNETNILYFPTPKIIYFCEASKLPDKEEIILDFGQQGRFIYKVDTYKFLEKSIDEIHQKKLVILIPFEILKLKNLLKKATHAEVVESLQKTVKNDIISTIEINYLNGNITRRDALMLNRLTLNLVRHITKNKGYDVEVDEIAMDQSIIFDFELTENELNKEIERHKEKVLHLEDELSSVQSALSLKENELSNMQSALSERDAEIARLKDLLAKK